MFNPQKDVKFFYWEKYSDDFVAQTITGFCHRCGNQKYVVDSLAKNNHLVCNKCININKRFYQKVTQSETIENYGISLSVLSNAVKNNVVAMETSTTKNGRKVNLYYKFQIMELQTKIYGSEANWHKIKDERQSKKISKMFSSLDTMNPSKKLKTETSKTTEDFIEIDL